MLDFLLFPPPLAEDPPQGCQGSATESKAVVAEKPEPGTAITLEKPCDLHTDIRSGEGPVKTAVEGSESGLGLRPESKSGNPPTGSSEVKLEDKPDIVPRVIKMEVRDWRSGAVPDSHVTPRIGWRPRSSLHAPSAKSQLVDADGSLAADGERPIETSSVVPQGPSTAPPSAPQRASPQTPKHPKKQALKKANAPSPGATTGRPGCPKGAKRPHGPAGRNSGPPRKRP
eukprot:RCo003920